MYVYMYIYIYVPCSLARIIKIWHMLLYFASWDVQKGGKSPREGPTCRHKDKRIDRRLASLIINNIIVHGIVVALNACLDY